MTRDQRRAAVRAAVAAAIRLRGAAAGARVVVVIREKRTDYTHRFPALNPPREGRSGGVAGGSRAENGRLSDQPVRGEYDYAMSYLIINGDCRRGLVDLAGVDAVVSDPPYGVGLKAKRAKHRDGKTVERAGSYSFDDTPDYVRSAVVPVIEDCLRNVGVVVVTPGTRMCWAYPEPTEIGCFYSPAGTGIGRWGFCCFQPILYYGKDPHLPTGARPNSRGQAWPNDANQFDHPCAKPLEWALWLVERATRPGWTVLDPFMGVGTVGVACLMLGRRFIGIEIDPRYCEIARRRLERPHQPIARPGKAEHHPLFDWAAQPIQY